MSLSAKSSFSNLSTLSSGTTSSNSTVSLLRKPMFSSSTPANNKYNTNKTATTSNNQILAKKPSKTSLKQELAAHPSAANSLDTLKLGDSVKVNHHTSGIVRFIGTTEFKAGIWAGIELDRKGLGKNDGSVDGVRYFQCPSKTGLFMPYTKLVKQQHLFQRPSTPFHHSNERKNHPSTPLCLPNNDDYTSSVTIPAVPPLPAFKIDAKLQDRIRTLETENEKLRASQEEKDARMKELQQASIDSIQLLEKVNADLERQVKDLRGISVDAIDTISKLKSDWEAERTEYQRQVEVLLRDITLLEVVLEDKMVKNRFLSQKNKQFAQQQYHHSHYSQGLSVRRENLTTPISEDDEDDNDPLINSKFAETCILCERKGHSLVECHKVIQSLAIKKEPAKCR